MPTQTFFNLPDDKRQRVLDVALEEFANRPYNQVSVSQIADRAGIAKGSIYQYFESKKEMFLYLLGLVGQTKVDFLRENWADDVDDFFEAYRSLLKTATTFEVQNPLHTRLLQNALESPVAEEILGEVKTTTTGFNMQLLQEAQAKGQLRTDVPIDMLAFYLSSLMVDFGQYLAQEAGLKDWTEVVYDENLAKVLAMDLDKQIDQFMKLVRHGMIPPET